MQYSDTIFVSGWPTSVRVHYEYFHKTGIKLITIRLDRN